MLHIIFNQFSSFKHSLKFSLNLKLNLVFRLRSNKQACIDHLLSTSALLAAVGTHPRRPNPGFQETQEIER